MEPSGRISSFDVESAQPSCCSCGAAGVLLLRHSLHLPPELRTPDLTAAAGIGSSTPVATTASKTEYIGKSVTYCLRSQFAAVLCHYISVKAGVDNTAQLTASLIFRRSACGQRINDKKKKADKVSLFVCADHHCWLASLREGG